MKILVTGGAGLIGRHVVDRLVGSGHDVVAVVREPYPESGDGLLRATTEVLGDVSDVTLMTSALAGVDSLVHLAAIPAPPGHTARELLVANSITTMTVLEAAAANGVRSVVMASSVSILGMAWSEALMPPLYLPVDEAHPLRPTEGYALSKECDEASARMAHRRWGYPIVAMRFPFTATAEMIEARRTDPEQATVLAKELWGYLDVRDASSAVELAIAGMDSGKVTGCTVLNVIADDVVLDEPLDRLLERWHPDVPFDGAGYRSRGGYDVSAAAATLGFEARYLLHPRI
jgi:nucleoside-diphosphate-sugar epimerase